MRMRSGLNYVIRVFAFAAILCVCIGCSSMPEPVDSGLCLSLLGSADTYITFDVRDNRTAADALFQFFADGVNAETLLDRTGRVCISMYRDSELQQKVMHAVLQGSYPARIVRSQLLKDGWEQCSSPDGVYYVSGTVCVAIPRAGMLLVTSGNDGADMEQLLARVHVIELGSTAPCVLPEYLNPALNGSGVVVWVANPQSMISRFTGSAVITIPAESLSILYTPANVDGQYNAVFTAYPADRKMLKALRMCMNLFAGAVMADSSGVSIIVTDDAVQMTVACITVDDMFKNFKGE